MKNFKKIIPYVLVIMLGVGMFYGMAHAQGFGVNPSSVNIQWVSTSTTATSLIAVIRTFVNWILGLLSLIALIVFLYGGFVMVTSAGDETKYKEGFKVLKNAAIGLAIVGLSWLFIVFIFALITWAQTNQTPVQ